MGDENEHPPFRKALMGVLRRPYNKEEYKNLSRLVKFKPLKGDPEDSRGLKLKDSDIYGKSPLEYHPGKLNTNIFQFICKTIFRHRSCRIIFIFLMLVLSLPKFHSK